MADVGQSIEAMNAGFNAVAGDRGLCQGLPTGEWAEGFEKNRGKG